MTEFDTSMPLCCGINIQELSVAALQECMASGTFTAADLASCYLERIRRLNGRLRWAVLHSAFQNCKSWKVIAIANAGWLRAVIEVNPDAIGIARTLDRERQDGRVRGPLHGMPFLIKDVRCDSLSTPL